MNPSKTLMTPTAPVSDARLAAIAADADYWRAIARVQSAKLAAALNEPGAAARLQAVMSSQDWREAPAAAVARPVADAELKALYVEHFGTDAGWLGAQGSAFIEGVRAARSAPAAPVERSLSPEQIDAVIMAEAERHGSMAEMCEYVDYDTRTGRIPGRWVPSFYSRSLAVAILAAHSAYAAPVAQGEPVAWLKEWDSVGHARMGMRRVDLTPECETWLANMFPRITPLYAAPAPAPAAPVATEESLQLLREAATLFRFYERSHRAKGAGHEEKVARNADIAARIESHLASINNPTNDHAGKDTA